MRAPAFVVAALVAGGTAHAQGPVIEHQPIGCIVAGHFPTLSACFTPASEVARARAYFRKSGSVHWYWVEFKPQAPCFVATLPKPTQQIEAMDYYVEVADKSFQEARLDDRSVKVVPDEGGCDKDQPVAAWVPNASVTVGSVVGAPAVPVGFAAPGIVGAGGIGTAVIVGAVAGGAGVAVGATELLDGGSSGTPTPAPTTAPTQSPTPTATAAPTTAPTATPTPASTPVLPFRPVVSVAPTTGVEPLQVTFDACASTGQNLRFGFDYDGDGVEDQRGPCRVTKTYTLAGVMRAGAALRPGDYPAKVTVWEAVTGGATESTVTLIHVDPVSTPAPTPTPACDRFPPTAVLTNPPPETVITTATYVLTANATDADGINRVEFYGQRTSPVDPAPVLLGPAVTGPGPTYSFTWAPCRRSAEGEEWDLAVIAYDRCGAQRTSAKVVTFVDNGVVCATASGRDVAWTSRLDARRTAGRLAVNNAAVHAVPPGVSAGRARFDAGENQVDVRFDGAGDAGLWRFELADSSAWDPTAVRVLAGEMVAVTSRGIVFRLSGRAGERVSFRFPSPSTPTP